MKKRLLTGVVVLGAAAMLCGFDSAETADSVLNKMQEASSAQTDVTMGMTMNVDIALNMDDGENTASLPIKLNADFDVAATTEPLAMKMEGSMNMSALAQNEAVTMKMYGVTNDAGAFETYVYQDDATTGESGWIYGSDDSINYAELMEKSKSMTTNASELAEYGLTFELAPEAADFEGTECYLLTTTIDSATLNTIFSKTSELTGQDLTADENVAMALSMLDGLKMNISYYVSTADYMPLGMHIDMNDSDLTTLTSVIQGLLAGAAGDEAAATTIELALNDVSIDASTTYGAIDPITVPDEAIAAVESGEAQSLDALEEEVAGEVAGE